MKNLKDLINESLINEAKVNPVDAEAKSLVMDVIKKWGIDAKFLNDVIVAINKLFELCERINEKRPDIDGFYTDRDTLSWMRHDYSDKQMKKLFIDGNLISVEIEDYGCFNWNNENKCWEEI